MSTSLKKKHEARAKKKVRVRKKVRGSNDKPRLCVFRSLKYTYAQLISDESGQVLASASTKDLVAKGVSFIATTEGASTGAGSFSAAKTLGQELAKIASTKSIKKVVFDRNGYLYHGRVAAVAEGAREGGLEF